MPQQSLLHQLKQINERLKVTPPTPEVYEQRLVLTSATALAGQKIIFLPTGTDMLILDAQGHKHRIANNDREFAAKMQESGLSNTLRLAFSLRGVGQFVEDLTGDILKDAGLTVVSIPTGPNGAARVRTLLNTHNPNDLTPDYVIATDPPIIIEVTDARAQLDWGSDRELYDNKGRESYESGVRSYSVNAPHQLATEQLLCHPDQGLIAKAEKYRCLQADMILAVAVSGWPHEIDQVADLLGQTFDRFWSVIPNTNVIGVIALRRVLLLAKNRNLYDQATVQYYPRPYQSSPKWADPWLDSPYPISDAIERTWLN